MIFTENLDHNPQMITLEQLPDGIIWLYLRKDAHKVSSMENSPGGNSWECNTTLCKLSAAYATETVESIATAFDAWSAYAAGWTITQQPLPERDVLVAQKIKEANEICQAQIQQGLDVQLSSGVQHFSLTFNDQTNIDSIFSTVTLGAAQYPYHAENQPCTMYSAADITALYVAYKSLVTEQTTYCNLYKVWLNRTKNVAEILGIRYGEDLPVDLTLQMQRILAVAQAEIQTLVVKLSATTNPNVQKSL